MKAFRFAEWSMRCDMARLAFAVMFATAPTAWTEAHRRPVERPSAVLIEDQNVDIVVRLRPEAARAFTESGEPHDGAALMELRAVLMRFGVDLKPQHPGVADLELSSYFTISNASPTEAEQLAAALQELDSVEAAYVQPTATPPLREREG